MLSFQDGNSDGAHFPDREITSDFRYIMAILNRLAEGCNVWNNVFRGDIIRVSETHLVFRNHQPCIDSIWLTGDATLHAVSAIDWTE